MILDSTKKRTTYLGFGIWRTDNRGQSWTKVYEYKTAKALSRGDVLIISQQRVIVAAGVHDGGGSATSFGLLLESTDGGRNFKSLLPSQFKGKAIIGSQLPPLHDLELSPDKKTLFALGSGVILRWKK